MALTARRRAFIEQYLRDFNGTQAAIRAGYSERSARVSACKILARPEVQAEIQRRLAELKMGTDEVLLRLSEQARGDIGVFFKITERWTEEPLPTQEILEEKEVADADGNSIRLYLVRQVCLDTDKLVDPRYSHLVKRFGDSPRNGLSIELYDGQAALTLIGKHLNMFRERVEHSGPGGGPIELHDSTPNDQRLAALMALYDGVRARLAGEPTDG